MSTQEIALDKLDGVVGHKSHRADAVTMLTCYVFLLMLIPAPLVVYALGSAGAPATILAVGLACWYLATRLSPARMPSTRRQPIRVAVVLFSCAIVASYISANRHSLSAIEQDGADVGVLLTAGWAGIALLAADGISHIERLNVLLRRVIIGATIMASIAMAQFFTGLNVAKYIAIPGLTTLTPYTALISRDALNRPAATALDPIELAAVLVMCLPIAIHQARFAPTGRRFRCWMQAAIIGGAVPLTLSRTAFTALAAVCLVVLPAWPKHTRRVAYIAGLAVAAAMFMVPSLLGTISTLFLQIGTDSSTTSRTSAFSLAGPFIAHDPWLGAGFDTFFPRTTFMTDDQYLSSLITTGVIGLVALLGLFVTGWFTARSARRAAADPQSRDLAQALAAAVAASAVSFASLDSFAFNIISGITFLTLGCTGALWRLTHTEPPIDSMGTSPRSL